MTRPSPSRSGLLGRNLGRLVSGVQLWAAMRVRPASKTTQGTVTARKSLIVCFPVDALRGGRAGPAIPSLIQRILSFAGRSAIPDSCGGGCAGVCSHLGFERLRLGGGTDVSARDAVVPAEMTVIEKAPEISQTGGKRREQRGQHAPAKHASIEPGTIESSQSKAGRAQPRSSSGIDHKEELVDCAHQDRYSGERTGAYQEWSADKGQARAPSEGGV